MRSCAMGFEGIVKQNKETAVADSPAGLGVRAMIERVVRWAFRKLKAFANHRGYRISWVPPALIAEPRAELVFDLEFVIAHLMLARPKVFFIQIGANDGISNDPLYKFVVRFGWEGILLEPLPEVFEMLTATYRDNAKLLLLNAAISEQDGWRTIYTVRMDGAAFQKAHQFSSFRKESLLGQTDWVPDIEQRVEERQVRCVSLDTLLRETKGREVDILQIDTEGYDFTILKMIDFSRLRPSIICYEHAHMSKAQQEEAAKLLVQQGYRLMRTDLDAVAYRPQQTFGFR